MIQQIATRWRPLAGPGLRWQITSGRLASRSTRCCVAQSRLRNLRP